MKTIINVALRDLTYHLRTKAFLWVTFGLPLVIIIARIVMLRSAETPQQLLDAEDQATTIKLGVLDYSDTIQESAVISPTQLVMFESTAAGEAALRANEIKAFYIIPDDYQATGVLKRIKSSLGVADINDLVLMETVLSYNSMRIPNKALPVLLNTGVAKTEKEILNPINPEAESFSLLSTFAFPITLSLALYSLIFMGSSLLMYGILEEKENLTLEVLLTSITPRQLLIGKLIGLGCLALIQLGVWMLITSLALGSLFSNLNTKLSASLWIICGIYFGLGFMLFATILACIGALSPSTKDISNFVLFITIPASTALFLSPILIESVNHPIMIFLSIFPITAPSMMPMRASITVIPIWQLAVSISLLILSIWGAINLSARLFRASILLVGAKLSPRVIWKVLRED